MNIHDYLIDQTSLDWESLLEEWHWLLPPEFHIWLLTRVGDLFITLPDGSIHMLDVGAGRCDKSHKIEMSSVRELTSQALRTIG